MHDMTVTSDSVITAEVERATGFGVTVPTDPGQLTS